MFPGLGAIRLPSLSTSSGLEGSTFK
jgi:hypothetical protein